MKVVLCVLVGGATSQCLHDENGVVSFWDVHDHDQKNVEFANEDSVNFINQVTVTPPDGGWVAISGFDCRAESFLFLAGTKGRPPAPAAWGPNMDSNPENPTLQSTPHALRATRWHVSSMRFSKTLLKFEDPRGSFWKNDGGRPIDLWSTMGDFGPSTLQACPTAIDAHFANVAEAGMNGMQPPSTDMWVVVEGNRVTIKDPVPDDDYVVPLMTAELDENCQTTIVFGGTTPMIMTLLQATSQQEAKATFEFASPNTPDVVFNQWWELSSASKSNNSYVV